MDHFVHNGTNSMGLIVQNGNLSLNSGMDASRARPAPRPRTRCQAQNHALGFGRRMTKTPARSVSMAGLIMRGSRSARKRTVISSPFTEKLGRRRLMNSVPR
jgi:hypothetical protein